MKNMVRVGGGPGLNFKGVLFLAPRRECVFAGLRVKRGAWLSSVGAGPGGAAAVGPLCAGESSDGGGRFWKRWSGPGCCRGEADACGSGGGGLGLSRWLSEHGHLRARRWRSVAARPEARSCPEGSSGAVAGNGGGRGRGKMAAPRAAGEGCGRPRLQTDTPRLAVRWCAAGGFRAALRARLALVGGRLGSVSRQLSFPPRRAPWRRRLRAPFCSLAAGLLC